MKRLQANKPILAVLCVILTALSLSACANRATVAQTAAEYHTISAADAKELLDSQAAVTLLDVREQSEYDAGHIPGAVLLPSGSVSARAAEVLPDPDARILVYCRSGARSRTAANSLVSLGYTQVYDLGGIIDWPYDVVTE